MIRLLSFFKGYIPQTIIAPVFKMLEACFELLVPLIMASIIDTGVRYKDTKYIVTMSLLLVGMGVLGLICSIIAQYFAARSSFRFGQILRSHLFDRVQQLTYTDLDQVGTSTLINRITTDLNQLQSGVNLTLRLFLRSPFIILGSICISFFLDPSSAVIFITVTVGLSILLWLFMQITIPIYNRCKSYLDSLTLLTSESIEGARVIRAFSRQTKQIQSFWEQNLFLKKSQYQAGSISALINPLTYILVNLGVLVVLYQGSFAVNTGKLTQGQLVALINYMGQILLALLALSNLIVSITKALSSANRIQQVLELKPSFISGNQVAFSQKQVPYLKLEDVSFAYQQKPVLCNISFCLYAGETLGIIGGTGSGKSTLAQLIPGFYQPCSGIISFHGIPISEWNFSALRNKIALVEQKSVLLQGTIASNLFSRNSVATPEQIWQALQVAQAADFVEKLPQGLETHVEAEGKNFSGGQKQRLCIARALVGDWQLLILDDSSSALDYATDSALQKQLKQHCSPEQSVIIISQRVASLQHCDKILVLDQGHAVGLGTHQQLLEHCEIYREICISQKEETA